MANINSMNVGGQLSMIEDTAARDMEANAYDATQTYAKEDICIYNDKLYEANTAITTPEVFNIAHWTETTLGKIAQKHRDSISQLTEKSAKIGTIANVKSVVASQNWTNVDIEYNISDFRYIYAQGRSASENLSRGSVFIPVKYFKACTEIDVPLIDGKFNGIKYVSEKKIGIVSTSTSYTAIDVFGIY